jgi:hypothetical protein
VQGSSCVQGSCQHPAASTLLLRDNSPVAFTTLIIAHMDSAATHTTVRGET